MSEQKETCSKCAEPMAKHHSSPGCPYEGWTNYETWAVKLWIDNEEPSYRYWQEAAQEAYNGADGESAYARMTGKEIYTREPRARDTLADRLKDEWDQDLPEAIQISTNGTVYADLLNSALSKVNWTEIAESLLEEVDKVEPEPCECIYEAAGHREGEGECPYGPHATSSHPDGVERESGVE